MVPLVEGFDWAQTSLGARSNWPRSLSVVTDTILSGGFPAIVLWGPDLVQIYNDGYRELMGARHPGGLGQPTRECWPEMWSINGPIYDRVRAGETVIYKDALYPFARDGKSEDVWLTLSYSPLRNDAGAIAGVLVVSVEVTERVLAERARSLLSELQHRVRNTLAIVRSIARRTGDSAQSVGEYRALLDGRLDAFSRTQAMVTRDPLGGTDLEYIITEELRPYIMPRSSRIRVDGPKLRLRPKATETMALAVHELATNAARYGALSEANGRIDVIWQIDRQAGFMHLEWRERDGPPVAEKIEHKGLGSELIERMLVYDLDARTQLQIAPPGLRCIIELPLNDRLFVMR